MLFSLFKKKDLRVNLPSSKLDSTLCIVKSYGILLYKQKEREQR